MRRLLDCLSWMLGGWPKISEIKEDTEAGDKTFWMEETSLGDGGEGVLGVCGTVALSVRNLVCGAASERIQTLHVQMVTFSWRISSHE